MDGLTFAAIVVICVAAIICVGFWASTKQGRNS